MWFSSPELVAAVPVGRKESKKEGKRSFNREKHSVSPHNSLLTGSSSLDEDDMHMLLCNVNIHSYSMMYLHMQHCDVAV